MSGHGTEARLAGPAPGLGARLPGREGGRARRGAVRCGGVLSAPLNSGSILSRAIDPLSANNTASRRPTGRPSSPRRKPQWLF